MGEPAGGHDIDLAEGITEATDHAVDHRREAVDRTALDRFDRRLADDTSGFDELDRTQLGGTAKEGIEADLDAGRIAPPRNSPFSEITSKLLPVPKSTTTVGPP